MMDTPIRQRRFYGKLNQNNESSQNFKAEPKLPQIETVHLTTFEELHYYTVSDVFYLKKDSKKAQKITSCAIL